MSKDTKEVLPLKDLMKEESVKARFESMLKDKAQNFVTTLLQLVHDSAKLKKAEPKTIMTSAATAASLNLNINPNFGYCYIIPYDVKQPDGTKKTVAQFQMGYKGFIQLAQRTGQYRSIIGIAVYANQFKSWDPLFENLNADFTIKGEGEIVGYAAAFELLNGFKKVAYWTYDEVHEHAKRYSKSYSYKGSLWKDQHGQVAMGIKTVLKRILSKYGPMEVDSLMSRAIAADQSVQYEQGQYSYIDRKSTGIDIEQVEFNKERERLIQAIEAAKTLDELGEYQQYVDQFDVADQYDNREHLLNAQADGK